MKKTANKKPAKKAATPKVKLKEGKYSHKFLVRLTPEIGQKFDAVTKQLNEKTYNGTLIAMSESYYELTEKLEQTKKELQETKLQLSNNAKLLMNLKHCFNELWTMKEITIEPDKLTHCPKCKKKLDEEGDTYCMECGWDQDDDE